MKVVTAVVKESKGMDQHTCGTHSEMLGIALINAKVTFGPLLTSWLRKRGLWSTPVVCQQGAEQDAPTDPNLACMSAELKLLIWLKICNIS